MRLRARALLPMGLVVSLVACGSGTRSTGPAPASEPASAASTAAESPISVSTATATPTSVSTATPTLPASPATTTTAPPPPPSVSAATVLRSAAAAEPGARRPLAPGAETVVHPSSTFEVELSVRAPDARLVLLDAREDQVPSNGARELSPSRTRLTLSPSAELVPGSRYALRLDGASDRDLHDDAGRAYAGISLPLLAAGSPPPPEPKKKPERKRRRR